jgi:thimet oligopeptidase
MSRKFVGPLSIFLLAGASLSSAAQEPMPAPGASSYLAGTADSFLASCRSDLDEAKKRIATIKASQPPRDAWATLQAFDTAVLVAVDAENRAGLAEQVHPAKPFRDAAQVCEQEVSRMLTDVSLDKELYNVLASLDGAKLDPAGSYYLRTSLRDYHRAGVDRDDPTRDKIRKLQDELVKIGQQFDENIAGDVRKLQVNASDLDGLPDDFKRSHPPDASGKVTLSTDNTDYFPFMDYAKSESARKAFFILYRQRAYPRNIDVMGQLLQKRHELANILGYPDWAAFITEDKMVGTEQNAADFIEKISVAAQPGARLDYEELLAFKKKEDPKAESVNAWDVAHLRRGAVIDKFGYDSQVIRPYFEYSRVLQGILDITSRMYGITYKPVASPQVWHPEVTAYDVYDKEKLIGRIYFDMFPRENKYKHYATFTLATGKQGFRLPEYVLVCNFPKATNEPGLMERDDVIVFFHEY